MKMRFLFSFMKFQVLALILGNLLCQTAWAENKYRYYQSSRTGRVDLAYIYNLPENYGGGLAINGFDGIYVYVGTINGEKKWCTFTYQPISEKKWVPGWANPITIATGRYKIVPNNDKVIFTKPDLSVVRTITDTFDKQISRDRWLALKDNAAGVSSSPTTIPGSQTTTGRTQQQRTNSSNSRCHHCNGTGRCSTCNGTGDRGDTHNHEPNKVVWKCTTCSGTGRCMFCGGTGRR